MAMPKTALEGIRVLDLGRYQAGPRIGSSWRGWGPR
jgi:crotonobetainyl-CoA:carnitine CoA-transferase CaiB-like acyl-CoA transferase